MSVETTKNEPAVEIFEDNAGEWRWRLKGINGEVIAISEGYTNQTDAMRGFRDLCQIVFLVAHNVFSWPTTVNFKIIQRNERVTRAEERSAQDA